MRPLLLTLGLLALAGLWFGPLPALARDHFFGHMAMHMGVVAVAAPLLALACAGGRFDPARKWPALFPPIPLSVLELVIVWAWHAPALHHAARHGGSGWLLVEQGSFLAAGLLVWLSVFGGGSRLASQRRAAGTVALLLTSMHMTLLGALLALSPRALYSHGGGLGKLTPLEDQHLGGAVMLLVGGVTYLAGGLWLTFGLVRDQTRKEAA